MDISLDDDDDHPNRGDDGGDEGDGGDGRLASGASPLATIRSPPRERGVSSESVDGVRMGVGESPMSEQRRALKREVEEEGAFVAHAEDGDRP